MQIKTTLRFHLTPVRPVWATQWDPVSKERRVTFGLLTNFISKLLSTATWYQLFKYNFLVSFWCHSESCNSCLGKLTNKVNIKKWILREL
jgi:hypothetical protein